VIDEKGLKNKLQRRPVLYCSSILCAEIEFLDIKLTKDYFDPCYSQSLLLEDFRENHTLLWFKKSSKKICETRKLESIHE
jgi:hypothetical protein